jgi:hypothetical protein
MLPRVISPNSQRSSPRPHFLKPDHKTVHNSFEKYASASRCAYQLGHREHSHRLNKAVAEGWVIGAYLCPTAQCLSTGREFLSILNVFQRDPSHNSLLLGYNNNSSSGAEGLTENESRIVNLRYILNCPKYIFFWIVFRYIFSGKQSRLDWMNSQLHLVKSW